MFVVRFLRFKGEKEGMAWVRDEEHPTKRAAIAAIRSAGAKPGRKLLIDGRRVRLAVLPS